MGWSSDVWQLVSVSVFSLLNLGLLIWQARKRVPHEVEKMQAERTDHFADATESTLQGARLSNELLVQRIAELRMYREAQERYIEMLEEQIRQNGIPPIRRPDTDELTRKGSG